MVRRSYDKEHDTFRHQFIVLPCILLALLIHEKFTFKEVLYQASFFEHVYSMLFISPYIFFTYINNDQVIFFILIR
jgi:hypothetical protein